MERQYYPKLAYTLRTLWIQNPTVSYRSAFGYRRQFLKSRTPEEFSTASGYAGGPTIFFRRRLRERKSREISPTEIVSLASPSTRFLAHLTGKSRSSFRPWRYRSSDILCCYEFQPRTTSQIWDADVRAASEIGWAFSTCTKETIAKERPSRLC